MSYTIMIIDDEQMILDMLVGQCSDVYQKLYNDGLVKTEIQYAYETSNEYAHVVIQGESKEPEKVYEQIVDALQNNEFTEADFERTKKKAYGENVYDYDDVAELTARVEAHLRRESRIQQKISVRGFGDIVVDYAARTVSRNGQPIELSKVEFDIVELLSLHPGQVFSRETIYEQVRGFDGTADNAVVKEHIRRIRNKLGAQYIETVWGCGYKWAK